jgi:tetratricopeptide (TPR) repeat protein
VSATIRRNEPCPCGSGLRYKECHGRVGAAPPSRSDAEVQQALHWHRQGRIDQAERVYRHVLESEPGHAVAKHYLGMVAWHRGRLEEAERLMRQSIEQGDAPADFHNNLGLLLRDTRRTQEAIACFHQALEVDPAGIEAFSNLGLALESAGRFEEAVEAYRSAIRLEPRFAIAHQNLARVLLLLGENAQAWEAYRWRLAAQGLSTAPPDPLARPYPPSLAGRRVTLLGEQGLGDVLFFLRFAPEAARRGASLAFHGDARLHPLLSRTGVFAQLNGESTGARDDDAVFVGDLPWRLGAGGEPQAPPPLPLQVSAEHRSALATRLAGLGPGRRIALTWRAGTTIAGPVRTQLKEIEPAVLGAALRWLDATWISVQRLPRAGEHDALQRALGARLHDLSDANDDLDHMLALLDAVDEYAGVSNANTHLRTGLGRSMKVLVPWPPEWRWGTSAHSRWFPTAQIFRQEPSGRWDEALLQLRASLTRQATHVPGN